MDKSTVLDTCVVSCSRLWHKAPVGCVCAFHTVGCPRVVSMVHVQLACLYCYSACAIVQDLYAGGCSRCIRQAMELCCVCVCACGRAHVYENRCPKSHQSRNAGIPLTSPYSLLQVGAMAPVGCCFFQSQFAA